jgi:bifunctional ADP-heptose synthase (sugar kinase/adenylyltransferase)
MISSGLGQNRISANNQGRLRDRLATADLRLSVLLDATSATGGVVYGERAPDLTPVHAQRIIDITDAGDQGLIALAACQTYAKEVAKPK